MKKTIVAMAALVMAATAVNAQVYLGGSVGLSTRSTKPEASDKTTTTTWNLSPTVGYYLNDRFDIGLDLTLGSNTQKFPATNVSARRELVNNSWSVTPFARYSFFRVGKFEAIAKLGIHAGGGKEETKFPESPDGNTSTQYTAWGINLSPVLAWSLTDHVVIYTTSDYLTLGYNSYKLKDISTVNRFGLNADAGNVVNTGNIQLGFIYKF